MDQCDMDEPWVKLYVVVMQLKRLRAHSSNSSSGCGSAKAMDKQHRLCAFAEALHIVAPDNTRVHRLLTVTGWIRQKSDLDNTR
jgi:hypothetical protein